MAKTIDLVNPNTRLGSGYGQIVIPDGETYIHVDGVRKLKLDKMAKCSHGTDIPDTPQFKGLNMETDVQVSCAPHTYYLELPPGYRVVGGGTTAVFTGKSICTGGSPTTIQIGAHSFVGFIFGVDKVPGAQTEPCGADVWSEAGVSIPITCASGIIDPEPVIVVPVPAPVVVEPTPVTKEAEPVVTIPVVVEPTPVTKEAEPVVTAKPAPVAKKEEMAVIIALGIIIMMLFG